MAAFSIVESPTSRRFPHRDRTAVGEATELVDDTGVACLVTGPVAACLSDALSQRPGIEWMGLLSGRVLQDSRGVYVVVTAAVAAETLDASSGHVHCDPDESWRMRRELHRIDPAGDPIGWWHSHTVRAGFSGTDRREQTNWTHPYSIGLLALPGEPHPLLALRGPTGTLMRPSANRRLPDDRPRAMSPVSQAPARSMNWAGATGSPLEVATRALAISVVAVLVSLGSVIVAALAMTDSATPPRVDAPVAPSTTEPEPTASVESARPDPLQRSVSTIEEHRHSP